MVAPTTIPPPPPLDRSPSFSSENSTMTANDVPLKSLLKSSDEMADSGINQISTSLQQQHAPLHNQRRHKVRFHKTIYNRRIPHLNNMSQHLRETIWIQPEEYLEIRQKCLATLKIMSTGTVTEEDMEREDLCTRGLEGKTKEGTARRREYKQESIGAVLEEQNYLWNEEVVDDDAIMEAYQVFSIPSAEDAYAVGRKDELAILDYINEDLRGEIDSEEDNCKHYRPSTLLIPSVMDKTSNAALMQRQRAALLKEIENSFFDESSLERRKNFDEAHSYKLKAKTSLANSLREYFVQRYSITKVTDSDKLRKSADIELPALAWDEEDSSNCSSCTMSTEDSGDSFTTELSDVFHSRKRRQRLLDEIEKNCFFVEPTIVAERKQNVSIIPQKLNLSLKYIFGKRESKEHAQAECVTL